MTEFSMLWETQTGSGDGANSYTEDQANFFFKDFTIINQATMGVLSGIDNELEVSGSTSPLAVATGKGVCYGYRYENDASKNVAVSTPAVGDTGGRIVLRASWGPTNTVRAVVVLNTDGNPAIPALTQTALTTWEVPLATFVIDTSGNIWTDASKTVAGVSDARSFALTPLAGMVKLREFTGDGSTGICTFSNIQADLTHLIVRGIGRTSGAGAFDGAMALTFNNDGGANYKYNILDADSGGPTRTAAVGQTSILAGAVPNSGAGAGFGNAFNFTVTDYLNTTFHKAVQGRAQNTDSVAANLVGSIIDAWWESTNAINRIDITLAGGNWITGSKITLFGVR